jgi:hypothetical protein
VITLTVTANGQIIGEYDAGTQAELAFQVAEACAKKRQAVTVFDGSDYIYSDGSKSDNPRTWPMPRPPGRPKSDKPAQASTTKRQGISVTVRLSLTLEQITMLDELGNGSISQGIIAALSQVESLADALRDADSA